MSTSIFPESIPSALSPNSAVYDSAPAPKAKMKRKAWTQAQVALLVQRLYDGAAMTETEQVKLIELGLMPKPVKVGLDAFKVADTEMRLLELVEEYPEGQRTLAIRQMRKSLAGLLT